MFVKSLFISSNVHVLWVCLVLQLPMSQLQSPHEAAIPHTIVPHVACIWSSAAHIPVQGLTLISCLAWPQPAQRGDSCGLISNVVQQYC